MNQATLIERVVRNKTTASTLSLRLFSPSHLSIAYVRVHVLSLLCLNSASFSVGRPLLCRWVHTLWFAKCIVPVALLHPAQYMRISSVLLNFTFATRQSGAAFLAMILKLAFRCSLWRCSVCMLLWFTIVWLVHLLQVAFYSRSNIFAALLFMFTWFVFAFWEIISSFRIVFDFPWIMLSYWHTLYYMYLQTLWHFGRGKGYWAFENVLSACMLLLRFFFDWLIVGVLRERPSARRLRLPQAPAMCPLARLFGTRYLQARQNW